MEYRADIDGLRAIAILLVVAFHVGVPGFEGGFIGVDVFFVISGYLISGLLWSEVKISGRINWFDFYARRIRRLLPALILTLIAVLIAGSFLMVPDPELRWLAQSVIATGTFSSNFFFFLKTRGYFGAESDLLPLLNTWSLAVEEQFYVVWPVILSVAGWCLSRFIKRGRFIALSLVTCITLASFVFCHWLLARNPSAAFYFMPSRLWELGLGGLLAIGGGTNSIIGPRMRLFLGVVGTGAVLGSVVLIRSTADIPGLGAIPAVLGTVLLIAAGLTGPSPLSPLMAHRYLVQIGKVSYAWYLVHWPLLVFVRIRTMENNAVRDSVVALASLGLATLIYRVVEQPIRARRVIFVRETKSTIVFGASFLAVTVGMGAVMLRDTSAFSKVPMTMSERTALGENRTVHNACPNLSPGKSLAVDCEFYPGRSRKLLLMGDSHAFAILPIAKEAAQRLGWTLNVLWEIGCPYIIGYSAPDGTTRLGADCVADNENNARFIRAHAGQIGGIITTSRATSYVNQTDSRLTLSAAKAWSEALRNTLRIGASKGIPTLLIHDVPRFHRSVPQCLVRLNAGRCSVSRADALRFRKSVKDAESMATGSLVRTWDPFDILCNATTCPPQAENQVLYRDNDHLSQKGASFLSDALVQEILRVMG